MFINPITHSFISITRVLLSHNMVLIIYLYIIHCLLHTFCISRPYRGPGRPLVVIYSLIYTFELAALDLNNLQEHWDVGERYWLRGEWVMEDSLWSAGQELLRRSSSDIQRQKHCHSGWSDLRQEICGCFQTAKWPSWITLVPGSKIVLVGGG